MDTDEDNLLKYRDFCNLCADQVLNSAPSLGDTKVMHRDVKKSKVSVEFSNLISQIRSRTPGRGGSNFFKRGKSVCNYSKTKNVAEILDGQPFVSTELHRFMVKE